MSFNVVFLVIGSERFESEFHSKTNNENFTTIVTNEIVVHHNEFDPTVEEALHLITQFGYAYAYIYTEDLGERYGSTLSNLTDVARGG